MKKTTTLVLLILTLVLTACSGRTSNAAGPNAGTPGGTGELSAAMQVAIGTIKLDGTENAVTAEQARELLPLWQTLEVLYNSDTAANQEIDALIQQIQDSMTEEQTQAITTLNLTRQDMMSIMQEQGIAMGSQNGNTQSGAATTNGGGGFVPGGGGFPGGGMPPDGGGFPGGGFQGQESRTQSSDSTDSTARPTAIDPNRIPTPLVNAVIEYLKKTAGS